MTTYILVRNTAGINLLPKRMVTWKALFKGRRVDGYCTTTAQFCAGVVDDRLPVAGVRDNDLFWLAIKGPQLVNSALDTSGCVHSEHDVLVALTAATSGSTTGGRLSSVGGTWTLTAVTDGSAQNEAFNKVGRAMSALTSAQTATDFLVDLELYKD